MKLGLIQILYSLEGLFKVTVTSEVDLLDTLCLYACMWLRFLGLREEG